MQKKINYNSRVFEDLRLDFINFIKEYYPDTLTDFSDASIGNVLIDLIAAAGDDLAFHTDKMFNETILDYAQERRSVLAIARTNGLKIPGRKASLVEVEITCDVPLGENGEPDENYLPLLKKGTQAVANGLAFELTEDCDFNTQFNNRGASNRIILPKRDSNNTIIGYTISKLEVMSSGETKYFQKVLSDYDITPFMEVILPENNVLSIEGIIFKEGTNFSTIPNTDEFMMPVEYVQRGVDGTPVWKYFEVDSLLEDKLYLEYTDKFNENNNGLPSIKSVKEEIIDGDNKWWVSTVKGAWRMITQKYITEYTDKGFLKVIFGAGSDYNYALDKDTFGQQVISRIINNKNMGILPKPNWTMFIMYRVGGGVEGNIAKGTLNTISFRNVSVMGNDNIKANSVFNSLRIINPTPSVSGKDAPSIDEIRMMIKYNNQAQNRAVTLDDYKDRIAKMPAKYGTPYRIGLIESNNKVIISLLSTDQNNKLTNRISTTLISNMSDYISEYKNLGDYLVITPGRIINLQVEADIIVDKSHSKSEVMLNTINTIYDFFSIERHIMGDNIYVSDLQTNIININGLLNLIDLRIYNIFTDGYSKSRINQQTINGSWNNGVWVPEANSTRKRIDLSATDNILFCDVDSMFEVKHKNVDIKIRVKTR